MCIDKSMHKLTYLVNSKKNIWSHKIEILKSTDNLMKLSRIEKQVIEHHNNLESRKKEYQQVYKKTYLHDGGCQVYTYHVIA